MKSTLTNLLLDFQIVPWSERNFDFKNQCEALMDFVEVCEVKLGVGQDMEGLCFIHLLLSRTHVHFKESGGCDASLFLTL